MEHRSTSATVRARGSSSLPGPVRTSGSGAVPVSLALLLLLACWRPTGRLPGATALPLASSWMEARSEYDWPRGTYGLPVDDRGRCPGSDPPDGDDWTDGHLLQSVVRKLSDETGKPSRTGREKEGGGEEGESVDYSTSIVFGENRISFCLKTVSGDDDFRRYDFLPGRYCVWKRHACPSGFNDAWVLLLPSATGVRPSQATTLPDADFSTNGSVRLYACCRGDGPPDRAIRLPRRRPFALLRLGQSPCQTVEDMDVSAGSESWFGTVETNPGLHPSVENPGGEGGEETNTNTSRLSTCLYVPHRCLYNCPGALSDFVLFSFVIVVCMCSVVCQWMKGCRRRHQTDLAQGQGQGQGRGQGRGRPVPAAPHSFGFPYSTLLPTYGFTYYSYLGNARSGQLQPDNNDDNSDDDDDDNDDEEAGEGRRHVLGYRLLPVSLDDSDENGGGGGEEEEEEEKEEDEDDDEEGDQSSESSTGGADKQGRRTLSPPPSYEEATAIYAATIASPPSPSLRQTEVSDVTLTSSSE